MDGRVAVHGVQFETGSTAIRQGSEDTMKVIAEMMAEMPELKIAVVGHTDNVGESILINRSLKKRKRMNDEDNPTHMPSRDADGCHCRRATYRLRAEGRRCCSGT